MNTETLLPFLRLVLGTGFVYLVYVSLLKKRIGGNASRFFLLAGTLLFSVWPFMALADETPTAAYLIRLPEIMATGAASQLWASPSAAWPQVLYFLVAAVATLLFAVKLAHLFRLKQKGHSYIENGLHITESARIRYPFSFGRRIFLPRGMDAQTRPLVLAHETIHVTQLHTLDLLFFEALKIVGWFNPFYYLLEKELRQTHEFTADEVMLQNGTSPTRYCEALLSCALAGMRVPVSYFHGSQIKTRIYMMNKPKNRRRGAVLLATASLTLGMLAFASPRLLGQTSTEVYTIVEQMPEYPGGNEAMAAFMAKTIQYPQAAKDAKTEGKVYVSFVVDKTGHVTQVKAARSLSPETDAEAVRAVKAMPVWTPGKQNGQNVAVSMVLPVAFKLQ